MEKSIEINLIKLLKQLSKNLLPNEEFDSDRQDLQFLLNFIINRINPKEQKRLVQQLNYIRVIRNQYAHIQEGDNFTYEKELYDLLYIKFFVEQVEKVFPKIECRSLYEELRKHTVIKVRNVLEIYDQPEENQVDSVSEVSPVSTNSIEEKEDKMFFGEHDVPENIIDSNKPNISILEARERLIRLRGIVFFKFPTIHREEGILRRSLIDIYIKKKITNEPAFHRLGDLHIDKRQLEFLPAIFEIILKIDYNK